jgi:hypothetical protein
MAQHHRTWSSGFVRIQFQPSQEKQRDPNPSTSSVPCKQTQHSLSRAVRIIAQVLVLSHPFSFDTTKLPMLKSAELLRF